MRRQVNDAQPCVTEAEIAVEVDASVVWTTMTDRLRQLQQRPGGDLTASIAEVDAADTTHRGEPLARIIGVPGARQASGTMAPLLAPRVRRTRRDTQKRPGG